MPREQIKPDRCRPLDPSNHFTCCLPKDCCTDADIGPALTHARIHTHTQTRTHTLTRSRPHTNTPYLLLLAQRLLYRRSHGPCLACCCPCAHLSLCCAARIATCTCLHPRRRCCRCEFTPCFLWRTSTAFWLLWLTALLCLSHTTGTVTT